MTYAALILLLMLSPWPATAAFEAREPNEAAPSCETNLVESKNPAYTSLPAARTALHSYRVMFSQFLSADELKRLDATLSRDADEQQVLPIAVEIMTRGWKAMIAEMVREGAKLRESLTRKHDQAIDFNNLGTADRIATILRRVGRCLETRQHLDCQEAWYGARKYLNVTFTPMRPMRSVSGELIPRPINEVEKLNVFESPSHKAKFKIYFEDAFTAGDLPHYRRRGLGIVHRYWEELTVLPDLNRALAALFVDPPTPTKFATKATLRGEALIEGERVRIEVVFDARTRYFTVQSAHRAGERPSFYRVRLTTEGTFEFLSSQAIPVDFVDDVVLDTYFRY